MAWPCISRVCCLARFWNQFDKSDLSVPLTIQNYSDIAEQTQEVRSVTKQLSDSESAAPEPRATGSPQDSSRGAFRARREPSYKPRGDYHPPGVPFPSVTQYKQDFKPWPIPRKDNFPWISNGASRGGSALDSPVHGYQVGETRVAEESRTSSYRHEYRPWTGVKPAKSARRDPPSQYSSPGTDASHVLRETSYQAAYSGEVSRATSVHRAQHVLPPTAPSTSTVTQTIRSAGPSGFEQSVPPVRVERCGAAKKEEPPVRTKLPPNPSAVFQSGSRVFNI